MDGSEHKVVLYDGNVKRKKKKSKHKRIIIIIFLNVIIIKKGFLVVFYVDLGDLKECFLDKIME
jgi:hypothetical protein